MQQDSNRLMPPGLLSDSEEEEERMQNNSQPLLTLHDTNICDVYRDNFEQEMKAMMKLAETYNCISMDTEFPGINIANEYVRWMNSDQAEHEYHVIKQNVENSRIIQIGLTLADEHGRVPQGVCTWQFNFEFQLEYDIINNDSRDLLTNAGINFQKLKEKGIKVKDFAEYLVASGIVLNQRVKWIVFHGGYDFAYLLKMVHGEGLPESVEQFYALMRIYYPNIYDLKYFIKDHPNLKDVGLTKLAAEIGCSRIGPQHQAGSDSLLTLCCYFKLRERKETEQSLKNLAYLNVIYGIGKGFIKSNNSNSSYAPQTNQGYMWGEGGEYIHPHMHHQPYYYHPQDLFYYYSPQGFIYPDNHQAQGNRM